MPRYQRRRPPMFGGAETLRLASMIGMLVIVGLLIARARDPANWRWLVHEEEPVERAKAEPAPPALAKDLAKGHAGPAEPAPAAKDAPPKDQPADAAPGEQLPAREKDPEEILEGTDLDPEQIEAIQDEYQALTDRSLKLAPEEMEAYYRMVGWTLRQDAAAMRKRAARDVVYTQLVQWPEKYRGKLVQLKLNVRRILRTEKTDRLDKNLYEVWGFTTESGNRLYVAIVPDLPEGMPIGPNIAENAWLVGYFLKLQGYYAAAAPPGSKPEVSPLLIGRLVWIRSREPEVQKSDWAWAAGLGGAFLAIALVTTAFTLLRRRAKVPTSRPIGMTTEQWLDMAQSGESAHGNVADASLEPEFPWNGPDDDRPDGNGKPHADGLGGKPPST